MQGATYCIGLALHVAQGCFLQCIGIQFDHRIQLRPGLVDPGDALKVGAVSYTHLDVYKRQDLERAYRSTVDPRLNYEQSLEIAMSIVRKQNPLAATAPLR